MLNYYITADHIGAASGGGQVTYNEQLALKETGAEVITVSAAEMAPLMHKLPDTPFLYDYLALNSVLSFKKNGQLPTLAHFYSGTFTQTVQHLKALGTRISYTVPAHDRKVSMEEFARLGIRYPYPHISEPDLWQIFSEGYRQADIVIAPSELAARFLRAEGCQSVNVIPHGCYIPEVISPLPKVFNVGYLGVTGPDKGIFYLLQAWGRLNYKGGPVLHLAGAGTENLGGLIGACTNGGEFRLWGFVQSPGELFAKCSVYVQPSVVESFGIEVLEAFAYGRMAIVSHGVGAAELIEEGVDGFIVPERDPEAIAQRIEWCRTHPQELVVMGQRARAKAERYSWDKVREMYRQVWNNGGRYE